MELHRMVETVLQVLADWDPESRTWYATSDDVPGLATGADTMEELVARLHVIIPELIELNGMGAQPRTLSIRAERSEPLIVA